MAAKKQELVEIKPVQMKSAQLTITGEAPHERNKLLYIQSGG